MDTSIPRFPSAWDQIQHAHTGYVDVSLPVYVQPNTIESEDIHLARRLMTSFRAALAHEESNLSSEQRPESGLWMMIEQSYHQDFYDVAARQDVEDFAVMLVNALHTPVCFGLGPGPGVVKTISRPGVARDELLLTMIDNVISCAEALGALPVESPEQGIFGHKFEIPFEDIIRGIEYKSGLRFTRPAYMGITGLNIGERIIDNRLADDFYCSNRISKICNQFELKSVCEIGGGFGGLALQGVMSGLCKYCIFDLPVINVVQAFFLMKSLGSHRVSVFNETNDSATVQIAPYWQFFESNREFDFVVNRDSMAEMPENIAAAYLQEISQRRAAFFSVNQEAMARTGDREICQLNVSHLAEQQSGLSRLACHRYWTRRGYVEELYLPNQTRIEPS